MFPIKITITANNADELSKLNAVFGALHAVESAKTGVSAEEKAAVASGFLEDSNGPVAGEAPGKPSAAKTARSPRTAEAAPSTPAPSDAAPETPTTDTQQDAAASSASAEQAEAFDYTVLQKAVNSRIGKYGKDALLAIAQKHGAASFKALTPDTWAAAHADVIALGE